MPKIKNWSRVSTRGMHHTTKMAWKNDKTGQGVEVSRVKRRGQWRWMVDFGNLDKVQAGSKAKFFDNKKDARAFAVRWMRRHPRG